MTLRKAASSQITVKIYIALVSAVIIFFAMDLFIFPWFVHSRAEISIPNVIGKNVTVAQRIISGWGLNPIVADTVSNKNIPPGHIAFQNPIAQSVVREGRNVYLTVSGGEEKVVLPNLRGRSLRDAKITLEQLELNLGLVTYVPSDLPEETVVSQGIPPGQKVAKSTSIEIGISGGPEIKQVDVPYIVGMSLQEAQRTLLQEGFRLGKITYKQSTQLTPNTIVSQVPAAGDKAHLNSAIDVVVVH